ncbi:alpha-amylase family glycosyl hydrolase [Niveibacterium sp. 24ML]|uniref:alpha-amylase family glycosyl hydrolase n=1 Tax=Niveibacterium sp. 24ML TaxID=2985512 RepID=UPI002270C1C2|nr:alpha-amylase family glycosyl hydrolase [Niveibacterium sp. 24ML]MCX9157702.1 alpha-amylase family glycosyl hydrolase [Niveibacterium sp. 24ML]
MPCCSPRITALIRATLAVLLLGGAATARSADPLPAVDVSPVKKLEAPSALPANWKHGAFVEIFVRSYQDSDGDGKGDLRGLISRLDYLRDLGITGIWLMPITESQDKDHGYAVANYRSVDRDYGTLADFDELLRQAHARGIGVIIDYVINHSGGMNPLFVNSNDSPKNPYRDWYIWRNKAPDGWNIYGQDPWYDGSHGVYFAGFWSQMPDFNLNNPKVVAYHLDNLRFWLNRGVDGFRFDAVGHLIENGPAAWENQKENHALMGKVREVVMGYPNRYMVCESPAASRAFAMPQSCDSAFGFPLQTSLVTAATGDSVAIEEVAAFWQTSPLTMASFLSNHDAFAGDRVWDQLAGDRAQYRLAAASNLLLAGTPFIYYGEEIGISGATKLQGDPRLRTPMSWTGDKATGGFTSGKPYRPLSSNVAKNNVAAAQAAEDSLLAFYKSVIALRKSRESLMRGKHERVVAAGRILSTQRVLPNERSVVIFNYGSKDATANLQHLPAGATLRALWPRGGAKFSASSKGGASVPMPKQSFAVFAVESPAAAH